MKQYESVLPDDFADLLYSYAFSQLVDNNKDRPNVYTNHLWDQNLRKNNSLVLYIEPDENLNEKIKYFLNQSGLLDLDSSDSIEMAINVWTKNSYIPSHSDRSYDKGITIYLNREWSYDDGGLFNWFDKKSGEWKVIVPKFNNAVVNDLGEMHATTPVLTDSQLRITLQCFVSKKEINE